ncbi:hypothetical protein BDV38DRAFT_270486 [Aspergillus pseudotamarii]|uniref:Uncharacterized protein n=1 Tax=Aspergillus pseudotamarii TaxID=132259 RepID=A0A5N6SVD0_ASPPS|nr:uncharacterized protein BDV38DRAFT_270486 [Aspergillus pseudotamarii]KAE8138638.1 hypothetical protein BDV38DRAFT_270486 [Aspergillus pseudotamarii]
MPTNNITQAVDEIIDWLKEVICFNDGSELAEIIRRDGLETLTDEEAVQLLYRQFEREFDRLKRVDYTLEQGDGHPLKGTLDGKGLTPSQFLFGEDFAEINRTVVNFLSLKWLLEDNRQAFTAHQPSVVQLSPATFKSFRDLARSILKTPDDILALVVSLVLGDVGKDPELEKEIQRKDGQKPNHDEVLASAIKLRLFRKPLRLLAPDKRTEVVLGVKVGAKLNIPQLTQGENVPGSLESILMLQGQSQAFKLKYLEIMLDVSGAGAHVDARGAVRMIEPVCQSFLSAYPVLEQVISKKLSVRDAYNKVLQNRGQLLSDQGFRALSTNNRSERAFLRLCAMGRVADKHLAELFEKAFIDLPQPIQEELITGLNVDGCNGEDAVILYYMPAIFAEALRVTRTAPDIKKVQVLQSLMSFMARTYNDTKPVDGHPGAILERDVSRAKDYIRKDGFIDDPTILDQCVLPVATC